MARDHDELRVRRRRSAGKGAGMVWVMAGV
jgi:hypothetical protein